MERDLQEARGGLEEAMRDRANMEKNCKMAQGLIVESKQKQDEVCLTITMLSTLTSMTEIYLILAGPCSQ